MSYFGWEASDMSQQRVTPAHSWSQVPSARETTSAEIVGSDTDRCLLSELAFWCRLANTYTTQTDSRACMENLGSNHTSSVTPLFRLPWLTPTAVQLDASESGVYIFCTYQLFKVIKQVTMHIGCGSTPPYSANILVETDASVSLYSTQ